MSDTITLPMQITDRVIDPEQRAQNAAVLHALRGGMSSNEVNEAVRERDGHRCRECGLADVDHVERFGRRLEVHRITPGSLYTLDGCVLLCCTCHGAKPKRESGGGTVDLEKEQQRYMPGYRSVVVTIDNPEGWLDVDEACKLVGDVSRRRIQALAKPAHNGPPPVVAKRVLGRLLFDRASLLEWKRNRNKSGGRIVPKPARKRGAK